MAKGGVNPKAAAGNERKAEQEAKKNAKMAAEQEKGIAEDWEKGANTRSQSRAGDAAAKADEAARKRREKEALLAEEEANSGPSGKPKKTPTLSKKSNTKKKDNLSLLEDALVGAADKKIKAKKAADRLKEEKLKKVELARTKQQEELYVDPLMANTESMIAGTTGERVGRAANKALDAEGAASGIDAALGSLNVSAPGGSATPSAKAQYKAFEERMLPEVKEDYPKLKLSQYKEKIFTLWKKSSENPANQVA
jgi:hypothetical protein